jgi:hypothetical protein
MLFRKRFLARSRRPRRRSPSARPGFELLEGRELPSTFTVTNLGDAGVGSGLEGDLRYAITQANSNGDLSNHVQFQPGLAGTIVLTEGPLAISKNLEIDGPGQDQLTVSGNQQSGVFNITNDTRVQTVRLADLTITDGVGISVASSRRGGGLYNDHAAVTLTRVTVASNSVATGGQGGGIYSGSGMLTLDDSTVADNRAAAAGVGGGIYDGSGTLTLHGSTVAGNISTTEGGGIFALGLVVVDHSTIAANTIAAVAGLTGAGITARGSLLLTDSTVADNTGAAGLFSAIFFQIERCTISGNFNPSSGGGGIYQGGHGIIDNSTIADNTALIGGGLLGSSVTITHATIVGNHALGQFGQGGGGMFITGHALFIGDSVVAGNDAPPFSGPDVDGPVISMLHNFIGIGDYSDGWSTTGVDMDHVGTSDDPLDPLLGPLQDNGGPTLTRAPLPGSPLAHIFDLDLSQDQRGSFRVVGHPGAVAANPADAFRGSAPRVTEPGQPFQITVTAVDRWGNTASTYAGTIHFSSTDLDAQLPDDYTFAAGDGGTHTFEVTLQTAGRQTVAINDRANPALAIALDLFVDDGSMVFPTPVVNKPPAVVPVDAVPAPSPPEAVSVRAGPQVRVEASSLSHLHRRDRALMHDLAGLPHGVYQFEEDSWKLCLDQNPDGASKRPTSMRPPPDAPYACLYTFRRQPARP